MQWILAESDWVGSSDMWVTIVVGILILATFAALSLVSRK